jgi:DNA-3-methyladenine glycosylase II
MKFLLDVQEFHGIRARFTSLYMSDPLTDATLLDAITDLTSRDPRLARIVADYGPPPLWAREPGFPTLVHIILEQQVSLASAKAAFDRLLAVASPLTPERFLELDDATLKTAGFSRQKSRYGR